MSLERARGLMTLTPDFPEPGILFRDLTPVLADGAALRAVIDAMAEPFAEFDAVAGIEARGFPLAGAIAARRGVGAVLIRKQGKLPNPVARASYELEYGTAVLEIQNDVPPGARVLVVDDVLATGGTARAACQLLEEIGASVAGISIVQELPELNGRAAVSDYPLNVLFQ